MSNISRLTGAGLIASGTVFSTDDQNTINSLSDDEVTALVSISQKVSLDFLSRNCGSASPAASPTTHSVGIVF